MTFAQEIIESEKAHRMVLSEEAKRNVNQKLEPITIRPVVMSRNLFPPVGKSTYGRPVLQHKLNLPKVQKRASAS